MRMILRFACILLLIFTHIIFAQFSEDIVLDPSINYNYTRNYQQIRLNLRLHIPGDYIDIETDLLSFSIFPNKEMIDHFGISWISFLWIPPALVSKKIEIAKIPEFIIIGLNALLNANVSAGNHWIRGNIGWKNDVFIFRDFLWVFDPAIGLKVPFPENKISEGALRCGLSFPSFIHNSEIMKREFKNFKPRLSISIDILLMYAEIYIGGK